MDLADRLARMIRTPLETLWGRVAERRGPRPEDDDEANEGFHDLLAELGSVTGEGQEGEWEAQLRLAEATIDELRENLHRLQPLGEQLAEAEKARLDLLEELESARPAPEPPASDVKALQAELSAARKLSARKEKRIATLTERIQRLRTRFDDRDRTASERWHELVRLRRENRELARAAKR